MILRVPRIGGVSLMGGGFIGIGVGCVSLEALAAHEFGHHFGLVHLRFEDPGIMNPVCGELRWTAADEEACKIQGMCR